MMGGLRAVCPRIIAMAGVVLKDAHPDAHTEPREIVMKLS